ncbi:RNA-guided endonuclease InsQ/TnpB family protein [Microseira wollei]|uniref:Transposase IS605 family protein n=1 Tax=Microseira wollei NIES-4236 TaxID=2530354 RepID=A0AAV3X908_9CYAN|nr:transposase [Microseira wollei]GET39302.1 putative transposase IS605 family protein [Microseira wollei NIES-4236]
MRISHQYRLLPTAEQAALMKRWLDMLRAQYNYRLGQRFDWYSQTRCRVSACPLTCSIVPVEEIFKDIRSEMIGKSGYVNWKAMQQGALPETKVERPWYKDIYSQVLQDCIHRVDKTFERYVFGDKNGNRSGKPRFKGKGRYRSFTYTQMKQDSLALNRITLPKIGDVKLILHRPLLDGFKIKTATVTLKADGWYLTLSLQDDTVPEMIQPTVEPRWDNSIGIDLGLEKFAADSEGEFYDAPRYFRSQEERLALLQKKLDATTNFRAKKRLKIPIAKLHQKIARRRKDFHYNTAKKILSKAEVVFVEDLAVKNMSRRCKPRPDGKGGFAANGQSAKSGMNKSIADAGWSQFIEILTVKAESAGQRVIKVDPKGTTQHCSECLNQVPKELASRWHSCPHCGLQLDRDTNSSVLIKKVGLGVASLKKARKRSQRCTA